MTHSPTYLLSLAGIAILVLLLFIIKIRLHAFIALIVVSFFVALFSGIAYDEVVPLLVSSFGGTLASVALLVGLGAMIGKILEDTGGAQQVADTLIGRFGAERAPLALGISSLLFGIPVFFDAGLVVMMPVIFSVARRFGGSLITYALPAAGAFAVMHAFVPPHPGPVAGAQFIGADIGLLLFVGFIIAIPTWYLGAYLFGLYCGRNFKIKFSNSLFALNADHTEVTPPAFSTVIGILLLPMFLIFLDTGISTLQRADVIESSGALLSFLKMIGKTPIALLITLSLCLAVFAKALGMKQLEKLCGDSLGPICAVIMVTGAGGMLGGVLRASGIGDALAGLFSDTGMPVILAAFIIATCLRVAQGSATVALTTTAALIAPMVAATAGLSELDLCFIVIAIAGGSTVLSHFNDSGFWLVSRLFGMDEKTTLKTWTVMETLLGSIAFLIAAILSIIL